MTDDTQTITRQLGLHENEYVLPSGTLTEDGWTPSPRTVYDRHNNPIEHSTALADRTADYDPDSDVAPVLSLLHQTLPLHRLVPVLGWFYAAPFKPIIRDVAGGFPHLHITGNSESGKTATVQYLWRCFGMAGGSFSPQDTAFTHIMRLAGTNSLPVWYDNYDRREMQDWKVEMFHKMVRKAERGGIIRRGGDDSRVQEYELAAPLVISGEQRLPPDEYQCCIPVRFEASTTTGPYEAPHYQLMEWDPRPHALAYLRYVAGLSTDTVNTRWKSAASNVVSMGLSPHQTRAVRTVAFGWGNYVDFASRMNVPNGAIPKDPAMADGLSHVHEQFGATND